MYGQVLQCIVSCSIPIGMPAHTRYGGWQTMTFHYETHVKPGDGDRFSPESNRHQSQSPRAGRIRTPVPLGPSRLTNGPNSTKSWAIWRFLGRLGPTSVAFGPDSTNKRAILTDFGRIDQVRPNVVPDQPRLCQLRRNFGTRSFLFRAMPSAFGRTLARYSPTWAKLWRSRPKRGPFPRCVFAPFGTPFKAIRSRRHRSVLACLYALPAQSAMHPARSSSPRPVVALHCFLLCQKASRCFASHRIAVDC